VTSNVVLKDKAAVILLNEINQDPVLKAQLALYFKPYCDCDIAEWIVGQIEINNQPVINKILELIAFRDNFPITRGGPQPVLGQLLAQYCNGNDFVGIYADGNGGQTQKTIEVNSVAQKCVGVEQALFYFPLMSQAAALEAGSTNIQFDTNSYVPHFDYYNLTNIITGYRVLLSSPKVARLQVKIGGLFTNDYSNVSIVVSNPSFDPNYYFDDPSLVSTPLIMGLEHWAHGPFDLTFNPSTRIISITKPVSTSNSSYIAGYADIVIYKGDKIVGALEFSYACEPYDPDEQARLGFPRYDLLMFTQGSEIT